MNEEQCISKLRENGYKVTPQRLAICREILSRKDHPTAEQIFEKVSKIHRTISITTVYHTIEMLKEMGLVSELGFNSKPSRFDPNTSIHVNVICKDCGNIWDYESDIVKSKWTEIVKDMKLDIIGQRVDVYVVCDDCSD
ncbi:MAG: Fur family transcriptional regulator [Candidatus Thorarchaeota archaeon]